MFLEGVSGGKLRVHHTGWLAGWLPPGCRVLSSAKRLESKRVVAVLRRVVSVLKQVVTVFKRVV